MAEAIMPPLATRPDEACTLVCDALSDGDLEAALAQYEPTAIVASAPARTAQGHDELRGLLASAAAARALFTVLVRHVLVAGDIALVCGRWSAGGSGGGTGQYWSVVRRDPDSRWRIAVEHIVPDDADGEVVR